MLISWCFRGFWLNGVVFEVFNSSVWRYFDGVWVCLEVFLSKMRAFDTEKLVVKFVVWQSACCSVLQRASVWARCLWGRCVCWLFRAVNVFLWCSNLQYNS